MNKDPGTERKESNNDQGAGLTDGSNTDLAPANDQAAALPPGDAGESCPGFLEMFYGVLFEPVKTMKTVAQAPPLGTVAIVVTVLTLLGTTMGFLTFSRVLEQSLQAADLEQLLTGVQAMAPFWVVISLLMGYVKWFAYSGVLHLVADLLGGQGKVRGVFAVVGLAGLPSAIIIPFQFLGYWFGMGNIAVTIILGLASLAVGIWSIVLLVVGVRAVHRLSAGMSVLTVLTPYLALILFLIILIVALTVLTISLPKANLPGYF